MDKREYRAKLEQLREDPNLIPGIYNYCDRWCERCPFTSRCLTYAMEAGEDAVADSDPERFWNRLQVAYEATLGMIDEQEEAMGLGHSEPDADWEEYHQRAYRRIREHPILVNAKAYRDAATAWLEESGDALEEVAAELLRADHLDLPGRHPAEEADLLNDALEVIHWYLFFIEVKFYRALGSITRMRDGKPPAGGDYGSAKLALIAIDRCIAAWGLLLKHCPGQEDDLLPILASLQKARRLGERTFPTAREFHRPGFDD